jgi:hypothetical protein
MTVRKGVEDSSEVLPPGASVPVFVSYASQDAAIANSIVEHLESQTQMLDRAAGCKARRAVCGRHRPRNQ